MRCREPWVGESGLLATPVLLVVWCSLLIAVAVIDVGAYLVAASRAQGAADAAALAAVAADLAEPSAAPLATARSVAERNGGRVESCACRSGQPHAEVEVSVPVGGLFIARVTGAQRITATAEAQLVDGAQAPWPGTSHRLVVPDRSRWTRTTGALIVHAARHPPDGATYVYELTPDDLLRLEVAREEFAPDGIYLDSATMGLPPRRGWDALQEALAAWRTGTSDAVGHDTSVAAARAAYATLVGVTPEDVAVGSQVSVFAGLVAASLPTGSEVLTAAGDFTSVLFPFHAQATRGVTIREVPLEELAERVTADTTLVAVSAVQSADGRIADLDALRTACAATGTRIFLDTTQAVGWLPIDASAYAYTTGGGYKWLLAPRGTAFLTVQPDLVDGLTPHNAGWYAGEDRWDSIYGSPLRLASSARRFDVSPAWYSWVGQAPALELLVEVGRDRLHGYAVGLATRFQAGVDLPTTGSAIVSAQADDQVPQLLGSAGIAASVRAGRLRLSFHLSTSPDDVDRAIEVLAGHLRP